VIFVVTQQGEVKELSEVSSIVEALMHGKTVNDIKIYYPKELLIKEQN